MAGAFGPSWQRQWRAHLAGQPKKVLALGVLVAVMLGMWGKVLFTGKPVPAQASANVTSSNAGAPIIEAKSGLSQATRALEQFTREPSGVIHRNLFLVKLDYFAKDGARPAGAREAGQGFWEELAKSSAAKADQEKAKRILIENLYAQAAKLELQSTVMSSVAPKAMINGMLVGEGDTVAGFRIVKIEARRVIVEREGVKLEVVFRF